MLDRAERWGILPSYHGWQGDLVETSGATKDAILAAMGATQDQPPRMRRPKLSNEPCYAPPQRTWGWAIQLYALRSRDSWGIGDLGDLRRFGRWSKKRGASLILLNPLGAQTPTLPYEPSPYYASSRRFRNVLYLRIEDVEGADKVAEDMTRPRSTSSSSSTTTRSSSSRRKRSKRSSRSRLSRRDSPVGCAARDRRCATSPPSTRWPKSAVRPGGAGRNTSGTRATTGSCPAGAGSPLASRFTSGRRSPPTASAPEHHGGSG